jgi:hypothetical protein
MRFMNAKKEDEINIRPRTCDHRIITSAQAIRK